MYGELGSAHRYAPDGLAGEALDELINRAYAEVAKAARPTSALLDGSAAEQRRRRMERRALAAVICALPARRAASGPDGQEAARSRGVRAPHPAPAGECWPRHLGGATRATRAAADCGWRMNVTDVHNARPGGSNRQELAHRVGAPKSPAAAIEEIGMVQVHTCVSVHCDQCGDSLGNPGVEEHYLTEEAALDAAAAGGWRVGPGGRLWCSACGPVLTCEAEGHEFSEWRHPTTPDGRPVGSEYRHCRRCCLHESRPATWLFVTQLLLAASADAGEVA